MIILTIRTDKPEAEIGIYKDSSPLTYHKWLAHRQLAETIHQEIKSLLIKSDLSLKDVDGVVVYKGPGSFTGLRIGISVANALADSLKVPIIGAGGENWIDQGITRIIEDGNDQIVIPEYGAPANVTKPKK